MGKDPERKSWGEEVRLGKKRGSSTLGNHYTSPFQQDTPWESYTAPPRDRHSSHKEAEKGCRDFPTPQSSRTPPASFYRIHRAIPVLPSGLGPHPRHSVIISPSPAAACDS